MWSISSPFTSPTDTRWQSGTHNRHHIVFLLKNIILLGFILVVIIEYPLFKSWWENETYERHRSWQWAPYYFWYRIGIALIPDLFVTTVSLFLILNPLRHLANSFHPIFALCTSVFMFGLYVAVCAVNITLVAANEVGFYNVEMWYGITYTEVMFQFALALCYLGMFVYSCKAVHRWRMANNSAWVASSIANRQGAIMAGEEGRL